MRKKKKLACWLLVALIIASPFIYWMMQNKVKTFVDMGLFGMVIGYIFLDIIHFFKETLNDK